jgi:ABC-type multidrug transport system ATPase subunit
VVFDGQDIFTDPVAHRRRLGYLPQEFGVHPGVSALVMLDHLAVLKGIGPTRARRAEVEAQLVRTNLWAHRHRAVSGFSGGMRQRFGIAQALLGAPALVVVDEPTAGLDPEERDRFHALLGEIGEEVVVLLSTHIVEDVRQLCPRLAVLHGGRIVREGTPEALVTELAGRIWSAPATLEEVRALALTTTVLSSQWHAGRRHVRVLADTPPSPAFAGVEPELADAYFAALDRGGAPWR